MPKFTDTFLAGFVLQPGQKDRLAFDTVTPGLGVRITTKGTRLFLAQWTDPATKRKIREPLGVWGNLTIEQARNAAKVRLGDVARGINPKAVRQKAKMEADRERAENLLTFDALLTDWETLHLASRRPSYAAEAVRAVRYAFAGMMTRPAAKVTRADAIKELEKLVKAGKTSIAGRTLAYARAAFHWAEKRGKVPGNPFQGLPIAAGTSERERVLTEIEVGEVWAAAGLLGEPFGPFIRLLLLTLQRRSEVAGLSWSELSADHTVWTIPGPRMKNGKPHVVHLAEAARKVLAGVTRTKGQDLIFSTTGKTPISGISKAKANLDTKIMEARLKAATENGIKPSPLVPWRLHDFRRTGVSTLAAMGVDSIVADKLLAHKAGKLSGVASVYQRHDFAAERKAALEAWAVVCDKKMRGQT